VVAASPASEQSVELKASILELVGDCPAATYPLQKKRHSLEFLRSIAHLRPRTNTIGATMRIRAALSFATHDFFRSQGFVNVHTPLITASDSEGAGELFRVTTLPPGAGARTAPAADATAAEAAAPMSAEALAALEAQISDAGATVRQLKTAEPKDKDAIAAAVASLLALKAQLSGSAAPAGSTNAAEAPPAADALADDFFGRAAYLTVSGQLNAETYACALGDVYTFGPTFRAEDSNTARHLAEFWMIEPEMAFADLTANMDNAEAYVKHVVEYALRQCPDDFDLFAEFFDKARPALALAVGGGRYLRHDPKSITDLRLAHTLHLNQSDRKTAAPAFFSLPPSPPFYPNLWNGQAEYTEIIAMAVRSGHPCVGGAGWREPWRFPARLYPFSPVP
jgi:asparaginyl-tRNA synthetase